MRILIVEDEVSIRVSLDRFLQRNGFETILAENGRVALELLSRKIPNIIILDVNMPEMNGFEFSERMRDDVKYQTIPIIMMTALSDVNDVKRGLESGAIEYLRKPVHHIEILARIHSIQRLMEMQRKLSETKYHLGVTQMAVTTSHEINSPLQVITGYIDLLKNESNDFTPQQKEYIRHIADGAARISKVMDQVRNMSLPVTEPYTHDSQTMMINLEKSQNTENHEKS